MSDTPNIYRIVIQVSDMQRCVAFYTELLGIDGRDLRGTRHYFDGGPVILALVDVTAGGLTALPNPDNIYFSVNDLEAVFERAKQLDCLAEKDVHGDPAGEIVKRPWGERCFYASDPSGNPLCFVDVATLFTGRR
jgi:catechol 2,3-dioxygenase-like lactoylglutathione lyase family enzyme